MDDVEAYMQLVLCNTQSELHPLEEGKHAADSGMDLKSYAEAAGKAYRTLYDKTRAYQVMAFCTCKTDSIRDSWRNLAEIHAAPKWLREAMVGAMLHNAWTVAVTRTPTNQPDAPPGDGMHRIRPGPINAMVDAMRG